jgi:hypothetical protein
MFTVDLSTRDLVIAVLVDDFSVHASAEDAAANAIARRDPATVVFFPGCGDDR